MARIDYYQIQSKIAEQLRGNSDLVGAAVEIEREFIFGGMDVPPWIGIYLDRRDAPSDQPIAAGMRTRYELRFSIWCWCSGLDIQGALQARDDLLGRVEIALMQDRTFSDVVDTSWMLGGDMQTLKLEDSRYLIGAEIELVAVITAST